MGRGACGEGDHGGEPTGKRGFSWGIQADVKGVQAGGSRGQIPSRHSFNQKMPDHPLDPFPVIS